MKHTRDFFIFARNGCALTQWCCMKRSMRWKEGVLHNHDDNDDDMASVEHIPSNNEHLLQRIGFHLSL